MDLTHLTGRKHTFLQFIKAEHLITLIIIGGFPFFLVLPNYSILFLDDFLKDNALINPVQIGFTKKARTADHMFVLRTLIEKYTKDKCGKLFACFIDFRKAFDTVIHDIMLYKILKTGIAGNFYNVIKNMYVNNYLSVKMQDGFTHSFVSNWC